MKPSPRPTNYPTHEPSNLPTLRPTLYPTSYPTSHPTATPTTKLFHQHEIDSFKFFVFSTVAIIIFSFASLILIRKSCFGIQETNVQENNDFDTEAAELLRNHQLIVSADTVPALQNSYQKPYEIEKQFQQNIMKSATSASTLIDSPKREYERSFEMEHSNIHDESPLGCTDIEWLPLLPSKKRRHHVADDEHSRSHRPIPQINAEDHMVYRKVGISIISSPGNIRASLADGKIDNKEGVSSPGLKGTVWIIFNSQIVNHALFAFKPSYSSRATFADEHENWPIQVCNADNKYILEAEISLCTVYVCMYMCVVKLCFMFRDSHSGGEDSDHEIPTTEGGSAQPDTIPSAEYKASASATVGKGPGPSTSNAPSVLDEPRRHVFVDESNIFLGAQNSGS